MKRTDTLLAEMDKALHKIDIGEAEKAEIMKALLKTKEEKINLMITGATGCGKSSTINALFNTEKAKVGVGADPETMSIEKYELDNLTLWDSPGLGDGKEKDIQHSKNILDKLCELDENGKPLIDVVLVILDGSSRDLGTSYHLINSVIIPCLGENAKDRIIVAINQCDVAMKGRNWDYENNVPEPALVTFLDEKVESIHRRIKEGTGVDITPIYYSAGFKDGDEPQTPPYNLSKLLHFIVQYTPVEKRMGLVDHINAEKIMLEKNDEKEDYFTRTLNNIEKTVMDTIDRVAASSERGEEIGEAIGGVFGTVGEKIGGAVGAGVGAVVGVAREVGNAVTGAVSNFFGGGGGGGGGGCYITTAICADQGKPDHCYELTRFREFRDNWLWAQPDGKQLVRRYYATAPQIVKKIDSRHNATEIYNDLSKNYLSKCLNHLERGENMACKNTYVSMMDYLYEQEDLWQSNSAT